MNTNFSKIKFSGTIKVETGLHIGGSSEFAAIGAIDSPVIKDPLTNLPIIPGSSLKGKMRSLLAKALNEGTIPTSDAFNHDDEKIIRLFGASAAGDKKEVVSARLLFRDSILSNSDELNEKGARNYTETKFENTIDRFSAVANPRQIERVIRGSKFNFELIYDVTDATQATEDLETILLGFKLLENDYLGGSGSRGYGKVSFKDLKAQAIIGDFDIESLNQQLAALTEE